MRFNQKSEIWRKKSEKSKYIYLNVYIFWGTHLLKNIRLFSQKRTISLKKKILKSALFKKAINQEVLNCKEIFYKTVTNFVFSRHSSIPKICRSLFE